MKRTTLHHLLFWGCLFLFCGQQSLGGLPVAAAPASGYLSRHTNTVYTLTSPAPAQISNWSVAFYTPGFATQEFDMHFNATTDAQVRVIVVPDYALALSLSDATKYPTLAVLDGMMTQTAKTQVVYLHSAAAPAGANQFQFITNVTPPQTPTWLHAFAVVSTPDGIVYFSDLITVFYMPIFTFPAREQTTDLYWVTPQSSRTHPGDTLELRIDENYLLVNSRPLNRRDVQFYYGVVVFTADDRVYGTEFYLKPALESQYNIAPYATFDVEIPIPLREGEYDVTVEMYGYMPQVNMVLAFQPPQFTIRVFEPRPYLLGLAIVFFAIAFGTIAFYKQRTRTTYLEALRRIRAAENTVRHADPIPHSTPGDIPHEN